MSDTHLWSALSPAEARRIDQACSRFEEAWEAGRRPRPEDYLGAAAEPERSALLHQLLLLDWDFRRRAGDHPRAADYLARFPGDGALIDDVRRELAGSGDNTRVGWDDPHATPERDRSTRGVRDPGAHAAHRGRAGWTDRHHPGHHHGARGIARRRGPAGDRPGLERCHPDPVPRRRHAAEGGQPDPCLGAGGHLVRRPPACR